MLSSYKNTKWVFFVPFFVCKFGDKKYPNFKNQLDFPMKFEKWRKSVDTDYTSFGRGLGVRSCTHLEAATSSPPDYSNIEKPQYYLYRMKGSRASLQNKQSFHLSSSPTCSTMSIRQWVRAMKSKQPIIKTKALRGNNKTKQ